MSPMTTLCARWTGLWQQACRLVLPATCAGCGRWETSLCPDCATLLGPEAHPALDAAAAGDLPIWAVATYAGPVREMVVAWKTGRREDLGGVLTAALRHAAATWARGHRSLLPEGPVLVVPAPSGPGRRLRGRLVAADLADAVALGLAQGLRDRPAAVTDGGAGAPMVGATRPTRRQGQHAGDGHTVSLVGAVGAACAADATAGGAGPGRTGSPGETRSPGNSGLVVASVDLLRRRHLAGGRHQAGRSARQRRANRATPPRVLADATGAHVLLVDDVVTTGATLAACARAVEEAGAEMLGALVLAATPPSGARAATPPPLAPSGSF